MRYAIWFDVDDKLKMRHPRAGHILGAAYVEIDPNGYRELQVFWNGESHDVLFLGYQGEDTSGRDIQRYEPQNGYTILDGEPYTIRAGLRRIVGYSAHEDQRGLGQFVIGMRRPRDIRLSHGELETI